MTKTECPNCHKKYVADLAKLPDWEQKLALYLCGKLIQNVWPEATPIQREQLQTGICSDECWDQYLGVSESSADDEAEMYEQLIGDEAHGREEEG